MLYYPSDRIELTFNTSAAATGGVVVVKVGPNSVQFHVHKPLLMHHSEYFRKALSGSWKEAEENVVTLKDVEPETCKMLLRLQRPEQH